MIKRMTTVLCALGMILFVLCAPVSAQPTRVDSESIKENPRLASLLERIAILDLGLQASPTLEDYVTAQSALSIASELDPTNADLARMLAEAAWSSGDADAMLNATRTIVRNDPQDTVAMLRLIGAKINAYQTVEQRLEAYARYLGPSANSIDASVRSRLALDAALLHREVGDADQFLEYLKLSQRLDPSNKDAVSMIVQLYGQQIENPVTRLNLQIKMLMADPLDPHIHMTIAKEFAREGAVTQAKRFLDNAGKIYTASGQEMPAMMREQRIALLWQIAGPQTIVRQLNASLTDSRAQAASMIEARIAADEPTDDIPRPEEIRMDLTIDRIRLLAAYVSDDEESIAAALRDINASTAKIQEDALEATTRRSADRAALFQEYVNSLLTLEAMRAVVGREAEQMRADSEKLSSELREFASIFQRIEPWILYTEGKYEEARAAINPESKSVNNLLILALANEKLDDLDAAVKFYQAVARERPLSAFGSFARSRMVAMGRADDTVSQAGHRMVAVERTIPPWVDRMIENPNSFLHLSVEPTKHRFGAMENAQVTVTVRNHAPIPLAFGASRPIESRFLLVPGMESTRAGYQGVARPKVLELNRRLRLKSREELSVTIDADDPYTDWIIDAQAFGTVRERWRVLQGFRTGQFGGLTNSPFGLVTETPIVQRLPLAESKQPNEQLITLLESEDLDVRRRATQAVAMVLTTDSEKIRRSLSESQELVASLITLYERASSDERAEMLLVLPHARQHTALDAFDERVRELLVVDSLVEQKQIPSALFSAVLLTRVVDPQNAVFEAAQTHTDQRVRALAELLQSRLEIDGRSYAKARGMILEVASESSVSRTRP